MDLKKLLDFDNIVIQCHDFPDADTIASGYGIYWYLKKNNKEPRLIYGGKKKISKPNLLIMTEKLNIPLEYAESLEESPQLLITVDCVHGESNVTDFPAKLYAAIDHHKSVQESSLLYDIRYSHGSCSSIVAVLLEEAGLSYNDDQALATALYYGLYTDTGGMTEISHPADRDLRDFARYNKEMIGVLINSNLSLPELRIAGEALNNVCYGKKYRYAVACADECDPNILGFINDLVLQVDSVDVSVVCCCVSGGIKLSVRSCVNGINAAELAGFIAENIGSGGGHSRKAGGFISTRLADGAKTDISDPLSFLEKKICEYCECFDIINAESCCPDLSEMKLYTKKAQHLGYVKSTDIFPEGTLFCIRTLEGDFDIEASSDIYIMINKDGSIYPITSEKFSRSYFLSDDAFETDSEYAPSIISKTMGQRELLQYAKSCMSKPGANIYASELTRRVKLYTLWDRDNYMTGQVGDYLAVRCDDHHDMYIVSRKQFEEIYEQQKL
ncbi:MAG: DHH family phosphoesterase [Oscillospiraceae bacterium]|nr:DHH family phosphoesterase [Oscillospiraceae bacterium]